MRLSDAISIHSVAPRAMIRYLFNTLFKTLAIITKIRIDKTVPVVDKVKDSDTHLKLMEILLISGVLRGTKLLVILIKKVFSYNNFIGI